MVTIYNRYIPQDTSYTWVSPDYEARKKQKPTVPVGGTFQIPGGWRSFFARHPDREEAGTSYIHTLRSGIRALWETNSFDSGDLLLILVLLLLLKEGEDPELIVILGLMILFGSENHLEQDKETKTGDG